MAQLSVHDKHQDTETYNNTNDSLSDTILVHLSSTATMTERKLIGAEYLLYLFQHRLVKSLKAFTDFAGHQVSFVVPFLYCIVSVTHTITTMPKKLTALWFRLNKQLLCKHF